MAIDPFEDLRLRVMPIPPEHLFDVASAMLAAADGKPCPTEPSERTVTDWKQDVNLVLDWVWSAAHVDGEFDEKRYQRMIRVLKSGDRAGKTSRRRPTAKLPTPEPPARQPWHDALDAALTEQMLQPDVASAAPRTKGWWFDLVLDAIYGHPVRLEQWPHIDHTTARILCDDLDAEATDMVGTALGHLFAKDTPVRDRVRRAAAALTQDPQMGPRLAQVLAYDLLGVTPGRSIRSSIRPVNHALVLPQLVWLDAQSPPLASTRLASPEDDLHIEDHPLAGLDTFHVLAWDGDTAIAVWREHRPTTGLAKRPVVRLDPALTPVAPDVDGWLEWVATREPAHADAIAAYLGRSPRTEDALAAATPMPDLQTVAREVFDVKRRDRKLAAWVEAVPPEVAAGVLVSRLTPRTVDDGRFRMCKERRVKASLLDLAADIAQRADHAELAALVERHRAG